MTAPHLSFVSAHVGKPCRCLAAQAVWNPHVQHFLSVSRVDFSAHLPGCLGVCTCGSITSGCTCAPCRDAQLLNAGAEIGLGFLTVLKLFTRDRNFILPFLVWCACTGSNKHACCRLLVAVLVHV